MNIYIDESIKIDFWLPDYLEHDIKALYEGIKEEVLYIDCLLDEIQGSINMAYYDHYITWDQAELLRKKYL